MSSKLLIALFLTACSSGSPALSSAKQEDLKKNVAALKFADADILGSASAKALAEIESDRLPKPLVEMLLALAHSPPESMGAQLSEALGKSIDALQAACQGEGTKMMEAWTATAAEERLSLVRERCKTDRFKLLTDAPKPDTSAMHYLVAHIVLSHLQKNGNVSQDEKSLIRYLATAPTTNQI